MKKSIFSLLFLAATLAVNAQTNQGEIKYSMTYVGDEIEQYKSMMPSATRIIFKGNNSKVITEGGMQAMMLGDVVSKGDEGYTYFVNHTMKTANKYKQEENTDSKETNPPVVTKENGTAKILGYTCQKYKVVVKGKEGDMVNYIWASKDIKISKPKGKSSKFGTGQYMYEGVEGFPLKMEMNLSQPNMKFQMIMTAVNLKLDGINDNEFDIPSGYKVEEGLPAILKMQMEQKDK